MFCPPSLAAEIDRAEGRMCAAVAGSEPGSRVLSVADGIAVYAGPGSPMNKLIGLGFGGPVEPGALSEVEAEFATRGAPLQAEVSTLADPELTRLLVARGYVPSGFEHVLGHPLDASPGEAAAEIAVTPMLEDERGLFVDVTVAAVATQDVGGVGGDAIPESEVLRRWVLAITRLPGFRGYLARIDGTVVGEASLCLDGEIAQFTGASTLPGFRRRGVQSALLGARLAAAARAGCRVCVVTTQPGSRSQQNVQRAGFGLIYARQLLVKAE